MEPTTTGRTSVHPAVAALARGAGEAASLADLVDLAKPRITSMVVFTTGIGLWAAPGPVSSARAVLTLLGTAMLVASANVFNSWIEREADGRMVRTRARPLPAGRVDPWTAFALAIALGIFAVPILAIGVSPLVALLGTAAHALYVLVYTPLKRVTPWALEIGAVPGAIPPLMGWAAATGNLSAPGWALFGILFFWQLPHFLSIALYLEEDYRRAGFRVLSVARGQDVARRRLVAHTAGLLLAGAVPFALGMTGPAYVAVAAVLGLTFVAIACRGAIARLGAAWARRAMLWSLVHLVVLVLALVLDAR